MYVKCDLEKKRQCIIIYVNIVLVLDKEPYFMYIGSIFTMWALNYILVHKIGHVTVEIKLVCLLGTISHFFSNKVEVKESEMKTESSRPFLRHRFLSKEEEVQKIPGQ